MQGVQEMKKMIKKAICTACIMALSVSSFTACGDESSISNGDKISIVATIFPQYDWARQIVGDSQNVSLTLLADNGTDLHSFEPTADDIIAISECDIFIYIGGESDQWVEEALAQAVNKDMIKLNLLEVLGDNAQYTETVEGMQHDHSHECEDDDCEHSQAYDEHIWLSLKNADILCGKIAQSIISLCPESKDEFTENLNSYINKLNSLDAEYADFLESAPEKPLLFGDRFPFLYLTKDYSVEYFAAFSGCSSESEASFDTIAFLADQLDSHNLGAVITIEGSDCNIADTVIAASKSQDAQILTLNSMQSVTKKDIENGADYLTYMKNNLDVLKQALS